MASDDLKLLLYILLKFMTIYNGPGGLTTKKGVPPENACRWHKAYVMMDKDGLRTSRTLKREFLMEKAWVSSLRRISKLAVPSLRTGAWQWEMQ
jgi:hypothetical protein